MFVKPVPGRTSRDPITKILLPAEGADVPRTGFWMRRLRDKDVIEADAPVTAEISAVSLPEAAS